MATARTDALLAPLERTAAAIRLAFSRPGSVAVFAVATAGYLVGYLYATGDLATTGAGWSVTTVPEPLTRTFEPGPGPFRYEPIALVDLGTFRLLFSPLNAGLAVALATLVGVNLALSYLAVRQPASCGIGAGSGVFAAVPALLSGSACCAPVLLLVLGIQASGLLLTAVVWLLPLGIVALIGTLVYLGGRIDPTAMT